MNSERTLIYPVGADESPSEATVSAVARHLETSVAEVEPDLHEHIDPDALDSVTGVPGAVVEFHYNGRQVRVRNATQIEVRPA